MFTEPRTDDELVSESVRARTFFSVSTLRVHSERAVPGR
jgi:hypothetical protein